MKRRLFAVFCLLLSALALYACSETEVYTFETEGIVDLSPEVNGTWRGENAPVATLTLYDDGSYELLDQAFSILTGGYIVEGEYVVLDGYGIDDPDLLYALRFDPAKDTLIREGEDSFILTRIAQTPSEELDPSAWFGTYGSELGTIAIGQGASADAMLVAVTPTEGVTKIVSVSLETNEKAYCVSFYLTLVDGELNFVGLEEELVPLGGVYSKL